MSMFSDFDSFTLLPFTSSSFVIKSHVGNTSFIPAVAANLACFAIFLLMGYEVYWSSEGDG